VTHWKTELVEALLSSVHLRSAMGEDVQPLLERSMQAANEAVAARPGLGWVHAGRAAVLVHEVRRRMQAGEDAAAPLAELEGALKAAGARKEVEEMEAEAPLLNASFDASRGRDPGPRLAEAERRTAALLRADPRDRDALARAGRCAHQRAAWLRGKAAAASEEAARRGLEPVANALQRHPRDPELWILKARLQGFAGERGAARESLDKAFAIQPLARGGYDGKAAEAELAAERVALPEDDLQKRARQVPLPGNAEREAANPP
jgi:hypothetical protein